MVAAARILGGTIAGMPPRIMSRGAAPATRKPSSRLGLALANLAISEPNEVFASQGIAVLRELDIAEDAAHVKSNGSAIAFRHSLGMSSLRITGTAATGPSLSGECASLAATCIAVDQGTVVGLERV